MAKSRWIFLQKSSITDAWLSSKYGFQRRAKTGAYLSLPFAIVFWLGQNSVFLVTPHRKLRLWSHLMKKSLMKNFIFCAGLRIFLFKWLSNFMFSKACEKIYLLIYRDFSSWKSKSGLFCFQNKFLRLLLKRLSKKSNKKLQ